MEYEGHEGNHPPSGQGKYQIRKGVWKEMTDDLQRALGRLEGQMLNIIKMLEQNKADHDKMERRVANLESKVNWAAGVGAVVIFFAPIAYHLMGLK